MSRNPNKYYYHNQHTLESQETLKQILSWLWPFFQNLSFQKQKAIAYILLRAEDPFTTSIYPSQSTLAQFSGLSRKTINELTTELHNRELIIKRQNYNASCNYFVSAMFLHPYIREQLSCIFPFLKKLSIYLLISPQVTLNKEVYLYTLSKDIHINNMYNVENGIHSQLAMLKSSFNVNQYDIESRKTYNEEEGAREIIRTSDNYDTVKTKESRKKEIEMKYENNINGALKYLGEYAPDIRELIERGLISIEGGINMLRYDIRVRNLVLPNIKITKLAKSPYSIYLKALNTQNNEMGLSCNYTLVNELMAVFNLDKYAPCDFQKGKEAQPKKVKTKPVKQTISLETAKQIIDEYWELQKNYGLEVHISHPRWGYRMPSYGEIKLLLQTQCNFDDLLTAEAYLRSKITNLPPSKPVNAFDASGYRTRDDIWKIVEHIKRNGMTSNPYLQDALSSMMKQCTPQVQQEVFNELSQIANQQQQDYIKAKVDPKPTTTIPQNTNDNQLREIIKGDTIQSIQEAKELSFKLKFEHVDTSDENNWEEVHDIPVW